MPKGLSKMQKIKIIFARMIAVFVANGLAVIGAGSLIGVDTVSSVLLAGSLGVIKVAEALARASVFVDTLSNNVCASASVAN